MFWSAVTRSISVSAIAAPVAAPPAWRIRRRLWPPSRPSAYVPPGAVSNPTPSDARCAIRLGPSSTSVRTAAGSHSPRPTRSVSSRCCSGESSGPIAAATPPWAKNEFEARSEPLVTSITRAPRWLAQTAA